MSIIGTQYYNKLQQFLIYKGKKSSTETIFRNLLLTRAKKNKSAFISELERCKYNATPYIHLKTRRKGRGKQVLYRVTSLEKNRAEKEAVSSFGKHIRSQIGEKLDQSLEKEIEVFSTDRTHPVRINRDKLHQLARRHAPQRWFKKRFQKNENVNKSLQSNKKVS